MAKIRKKKKIFKTVVAAVLGATVLFNSQSVWAVYDDSDTKSKSNQGEYFQQQQSQAAGTMLVFNAKKVPPALNGVTNENSNVISQKEATARRDAANQIKKELREAFITDTKSGYSGIVWTTTERKIMNAEVIERVMEKLVKCDSDEVGAMLVPGSETLAGAIKNKIGENTVEIRHGYNPMYVIEMGDYIKKMDWEEYEHVFTWKDPKVAGFIPITSNVSDGVVNTEGFNAIIHGENKVNLDKVPVWGWDEKTKSIIGYRNIAVLKQIPTVKVIVCVKFLWAKIQTE